MPDSDLKKGGSGADSMILLCVDTAETSCSIALIDRGTVLCEAYYSSRITHSRVLMGMIDQMVIRQAGLSPDAIDGFVVTRGPGSFTGVRIGISVVKGLAYAVGKPMAGVSSLDGIAWQFSRASIPVCVLMDAKRGEVYSSTYRFGNTGSVESTPEQVTDPGTAIAEAGTSKALFCGSGAIAYRDLIRSTFGPRAVFAPGFQNTVRAAALAGAAIERGGGCFQDPGAVLPVYLRRSDAEINRRAHASIDKRDRL